MMDRKIRLVFNSASFAFLLIALSATAEACSVCGTAKDEARVAYWATTAILSFLPLVLIGGVVYYIFKRSK